MQADTPAQNATHDNGVTGARSSHNKSKPSKNKPSIKKNVPPLGLVFLCPDGSLHQF